MPARRLAMLFATALSVAACSDSVEGQGTSDLTGGTPLEGEAKMFPGFSYDTGLLPKVSPAQVSFKASADGALKVRAGSRPVADKIEGIAGSGKLAIDLHAKLEGRLKVTSTFKSYDGEIPGLKDVDIAATAEVPFDPFLLGEGEEALAVAKVPETKLPDVPLSGVPGSLQLTVREGTTVSAKLRGTCLRGEGAIATFQGATTTSGTLVLKATLKLDLPKPLDKSIDLPDITVDLPETKGTIEAKSAAAGIPTFTEGTCGGAPAKEPDTGAGSSGPGTGGEEKGEQCTDLTSSGAFVVPERNAAPAPTATGGRIAEGTYVLQSVRSYDDVYVGTQAFKQTMRITKGRMELVSQYDDSEELFPRAGSFEVWGTTLYYTVDCPRVRPETSSKFIATPTSLVQIFPDGMIYTYGKL